MGSGKRASMREGPLANLFRKTETEGLEPRARGAEPPAARARHADAAGAPAPRVLERDPRRHDGPARRRGRRRPRPATTSGRSVRDERVGAPQLRVVGVGGGGVNAVNRMIEAEVGGVEFIALNTDAQSLQQSSAHVTLQIGADITRGLGSGSDPDRGRAAAMEDYDRIKSLLKGSDMVFITAGEGGGTGTGAAPVVARVARELGALTVGIVTKPFGFEGTRRLQAAEAGIEALADEVDTLIVVPEQQAAVGAGQADLDGRGLPRRRRRAAPGRPGHLGPDHAPGPDQPRLRRRAHDHGRRRQRAARHRHGPSGEKRAVDAAAQATSSPTRNASTIDVCLSSTVSSLLLGHDDQRVDLVAQRLDPHLGRPAAGACPRTRTAW